MLNIIGNADVFARRVAQIETRLAAEVNELGSGLASLAESYAVIKIDEMIYDTPERYYERTGDLRASIQSRFEQTQNGFIITLHTGPGDGGESYGEDNELGRAQSQVEFQQVLEAALALDKPLELEPFARQKGSFPNLEPRPFIIPAMVQIYRDLEKELLDMLRKANL